MQQCATRIDYMLRIIARSIMKPGRVTRGNFPLKLLTEPYLKLSLHTALHAPYKRRMTLWLIQPTLADTLFHSAERRFFGNIAAPQYGINASHQTAMPPVWYTVRFAQSIADEFR